MCKRVVILLVFFVSLAIGKDWWWSKIFEMAGNTSIRRIITLRDSSVAMMGINRFDDTGGQLCWVKKIDKNGDTLWVNLFDASEMNPCYSIRENSDGTILLSGQSASNEITYYDAWLMKLNTSGKTLWTKTFNGDDSNDDEAYGTVELSDRSTLLIATQEVSDWCDRYLWLLKLDKHGDTLWSRTYRNHFRRIWFEKLTDGTVLIITSLYCDGESYESKILKLDENGDSLWYKSYSHKGSGSVEATAFLKDGTILMQGYGRTGYKDVEKNYWLKKLDANGDTLWNKISDKPFVNSILELDDGAVWLIRSAGKDFEITKINADGDTKWNKKFEEKVKQLKSYCKLDDGSVLVSGTPDSSIANNKDGILMKIDEDGNILWRERFGTEDDYLHLLKLETHNVWLTGTTKSLGSDDYNLWINTLSPIQYCTPTSPLSFDIAVETVDSINFSYTLLNAPEGMIVSNGGTVSWTPDFDTTAFHHIKFVRSKGTEVVDTLWFDVWANIENKNDTIKPDNSVILANNQIVVKSDINSLSITTVDPIRRVNLLDLQGRQLKAKSIASETINVTLNTSNIASGVYLLQVQTMDQLSSRVVYVK